MPAVAGNPAAAVNVHNQRMRSAAIQRHPELKSLLEVISIICRNIKLAATRLKRADGDHKGQENQGMRKTHHGCLLLTMHARIMARPSHAARRNFRLSARLGWHSHEKAGSIAGAAKINRLEQVEPALAVRPGAKD